MRKVVECLKDCAETPDDFEGLQEDDLEDVLGAQEANKVIQFLSHKYGQQTAEGKKNILSYFTTNGGYLMHFYSLHCMQRWIFM